MLGRAPGELEGRKGAERWGKLRKTWEKRCRGRQTDGRESRNPAGRARVGSQLSAPLPSCQVRASAKAAPASWSVGSQILWPSAGCGAVLGAASCAQPQQADRGFSLCAFFSLFFFLIFERAIKGLNSRRPGHSPYIIEIAAH